MSHVALVAFAGVRVREEEMLALGMTLPGLHTRASAIGKLPSLGLLTLAGMTPKSWTCSYHVCDGNSHDLLDEVMATQPALVGVSALTASILDAYRFADELRRYRVPTVLGGLHATTCSQEAQQHFTTVVSGDGEPVWQQILADADNGTLQPAYRSSVPFDLARSPVPSYSLLNGASPARMTLQTQRGCPLACEFCAASRMLGPFREKPLANIERELQALQKGGFPASIELADDNTFTGTRDAAALFEVLASANVRYFTEVDWRAARQPDVLAGLASSGCVQVLVGLESPVAHYRGMGAKSASLEVTLDSVAAIQDTGVAVNGCFIVGGDGETPESIELLADFILNSDLADVQITLQTPFPGTVLHRRLCEQNRLLPDRDWSHYTLFDVTYQPDRMSPAQLQGEFVRLVRKVFDKGAVQRRAAIRRRVWRRHPRMKPCAS